MKKGVKLERKVVEYKGATFILHPGEIVYECNIHTGKVKEHPIRKTLISLILFWRKPSYTVTHSPEIVHRPAMNINRAVMRFKEMFGAEYKRKYPNFKIHK